MVKRDELVNAQGVRFIQAKGGIVPVHERDGMPKEQFVARIESMRRAAIEVGAGKDFQDTMDYVERTVFTDEHVRGAQSQGAVLRLLEPIARRNAKYVERTVRVSVRDADGNEVEQPLTSEAAQKLAERYEKVGTFDEQRRQADRLRGDLYQRRHDVDEEAERRHKKGAKYDRVVEERDLREGRIEPDARVVRRRRQGSIVDSVRTMPTRLAVRLGMRRPYADRRLSTYEEVAAQEWEGATRARATKKGFLGPTEDAFVLAKPDEDSGRALPGSKQFYVDKGYAAEDAERRARRAYQHRFGRVPGTIAWFRSRGFDEERAKALSEAAFEETSGARVRGTRDRTRFKHASETEAGSRAFFRKKGFDTKEADALSDAAFQRSFKPVGKVSGEAAGAVGRGFWALAAAPWRLARGAGRATVRRVSAYGDRHGEGQVGVEKAARVAKHMGRATARSVGDVKEARKQDYAQARDATRRVTGDSTAGRAAAAGGAGAYAAAKGGWRMLPSTMLVRRMVRRADAANPELAQKQTRGARALHGMGLAVSDLGKRTWRGFQRLSLGIRVAILLALAIVALTMPFAAAKYLIHSVYMLFLTGADYLFLAPLNALIQLLWFGYDVLANLILNVVINGVIGLAHQLLILPLVDALEPLGLTSNLARPTFTYLGSAVPQVAYLAAVLKTGAFLPSVVPTDAYGNILTGPELDSSFDDFIFHLPAGNARKAGTPEFFQDFGERLRTMTGCDAFREDCWPRFGYRGRSDGTIEFDFTQGPALFPNLIVPPTLALSEAGGLVPEVEWYAWDDFRFAENACTDVYGRPCAGNGRIDPGEAEARDTFWDASRSDMGRRIFDLDFEDSAAGRWMTDNFNALAEDAQGMWDAFVAWVTRAESATEGAQ